MSEIMERLEVPASENGMRLDKWIAETLQDMDYDVSRSQVQGWISDGLVQGPRARIKASDAVNEGDEFQIAIPVPEPVQLAADDVALDIVYDDLDVVVVNKPRDVVVHPATGHLRGTVLNGLIGRGIQLSHLGGDMRPGVVHRIDKDTTGLIVFAKSDQAFHHLANQFKEHTVERLYLAIVHGVPTHETGIIDAPIGRDVTNRQRMAVTAGGKSAVTHFHVIERFAAYTFLELRLETGRTHQIRVHLTYIGHPLAGDPVYGRRHTLPIHGQALHATSLGFTHPVSGERLTFHAPAPDDMTTLLNGLRVGTLA